MGRYVILVKPECERPFTICIEGETEGCKLNLNYEQMKNFRLNMDLAIKQYEEVTRRQEGYH